jgi:hypothetical protein
MEPENQEPVRVIEEDDRRIQEIQAEEEDQKAIPSETVDVDDDSLPF